jgi:hypothetical protein
MKDSVELLLKQLEKTNENVRRCQNSLTVLVTICVIAIVVILFVIFRGKGKFTKDEIIIGDVKDKEELHKEVVELRKIVEEMKKNQKSLHNGKG